MELDVENAGTWFSWHDSQVCLRVCPGSKLREFKKASGVKTVNEVVFDPKTRVAQKIVSEKIEDEDLFSQLLWDYVIVDWKNFTVKGAEYPCIKENKLLAMNNDSRFSNFVTKSLHELNEIEEAEEVATSKNL